MTVVDDFSPIVQGDTLIPFAPQFVGLPNGLTGIILSMKMVNEANALDVITCSGTWIIDDAPNGKAHYTYAPADVAQPGTWNLYIKLTDSVSGAFTHALPKTLDILPAP